MMKKMLLHSILIYKKALSIMKLKKNFLRQNIKDF